MAASETGAAGVAVGSSISNNNSGTSGNNAVVSSSGNKASLGTAAAAGGIFTGSNVTGVDARFNVFWANQAALSITLVVGTFFLVINLLLFAAIYRRNQCRKLGERRGSSNGRDEEDSDDHKVII